LPQPKPLADGIGLNITAPNNPREIFEAMSKHLDITDLTMFNSNKNLHNLPS
jgi:hypothetical protein